MSNRRTHLIVGTVTGLGTAAYLARSESPPALAAEVAGGAIGGMIGCLGPDAAEPAIHSWHRSTAHSYATAATILAATAQGIERWQNFCRNRAQLHDAARLTAATDAERVLHGFMAFLWHFLSGFVSGAPLGYLSHLALDALTPRGIPLLA